MNNTFNIQRFSLLLKRQWLEFGKIYLISLGVVLGILLCFYGFNYYSIISGMSHYTRLSYDGSYSSLFFRIPLFAIMGTLFVTIIASSYFAHLGQKPRAIIDLMIPASTFEKFMGGIFFTSVLGIGGYLVLYYLTDLAFMIKLRGWYEHSGQNMFLDGKKVEVNKIFPYLLTMENGNVFKVIYIIPFLLTSIFLLGSIYFERFHYIKTTICIMLFSGLWTAIIAKSSQLLFEGKIPIHGEQPRYILNERNPVEIGLLLIGLAFALIFWAITYVRLKEKEV